MADVKKVRKVLDYTPASAMKGWKDREYLEALNRRLNREVLVERPLAKPARDEAVRVVDADEWDAARAARERQLLQEAELVATRDELARVTAREDQLRQDVESLRHQLPALEADVEEKRRFALQLLGVRRRAQPSPVSADELAAQGWEVVPEEGGAPAPDAFTPVEPDPEAEQARRDLATAEEAIRRVEAEIQKIESEMQSLAEQEATLRRRSPAFTRGGYTLYKRIVGEGDHARPLYFFSKASPASGEPATLPPGHEVAQRKGGMPYLKKIGRAKRAPAKRSRGASR